MKSMMKERQNLPGALGHKISLWPLDQQYLSIMASCCPIAPPSSAPRRLHCNRSKLDLQAFSQVAVSRSTSTSTSLPFYSQRITAWPRASSATSSNGLAWVRKNSCTNSALDLRFYCTPILRWMRALRSQSPSSLESRLSPPCTVMTLRFEMRYFPGAWKGAFT